MKNVLFFQHVRHVLFVGILIPERQDKRSDRFAVAMEAYSTE
jgi:hypothetical protein